MTALESLIARAQKDLPPEAQERLADLVGSFLATHAGSLDFTEAELDHLRRLDVEPFEPADPDEVERFFGRRG